MILAIDTSTRQMGIALFDGVQLVTEATWTSNFHHTVELAPAINQAIDRAGLAFADIRALAVALGPGSFTSLRTGLAFAKGLALARKIPLVGIPTLDFLVAAQPVCNLPLAAVLEAGRRRLAVEWYEAADGNWQPKGNLQVLAPHDLAKMIRSPTLICGEMTAEVRKILGRKWKNARLVPPAQSHRRPGYLAQLGWERFQAGQMDDPVSLAPIYISEGTSPSQ